MKLCLFIKRDRDDCGCEVFLGKSKHGARLIGRFRVSWHASWKLNGDITIEGGQAYELMLQSLQPTFANFRGLEGSVSCAGQVVAQVYMPETAAYSYEVNVKDLIENVEMQMIVSYPPRSECDVKATCDGADLFQSPRNGLSLGDKLFEFLCFGSFLWVECSDRVDKMVDGTSAANVLLLAGLQNSIVGHTIIGHNDIVS